LDVGVSAHYNQPASPPNLHLFNSPQNQDVLVLYDEASEGVGPARERAYWLRQNTERIEKGHKPRFASLGRTTGLASVPVVAAPPGAPPLSAGELYAVISPDGCGFTLYAKGAPTTEGAEDKELGTFKLPIYRPPSSRVVQTLVTPVALVVGVAVVAGVVVVILWAQ
jgi:hypothetical protein